MRTNIEIDDALLRKAMKGSKAETKTKRAVVDEALRMLVRIQAQEDIRNLFGKGEFIADYDYKAMRSGSSEKNASANSSAGASSLLQMAHAAHGIELLSDVADKLAETAPGPAESGVTDLTYCEILQGQKTNTTFSGGALRCYR